MSLGLVVLAGALGYWVYRSGPFVLGLDLKGGSHLVYEAEVHETHEFQALRNALGPELFACLVLAEEIRMRWTRYTTERGDSDYHVFTIFNLLLVCSRINDWTFWKKNCMNLILIQCLTMNVLLQLKLLLQY